MQYDRAIATLSLASVAAKALPRVDIQLITVHCGFSGVTYRSSMK